MLRSRRNAYRMSSSPPRRVAEAGERRAQPAEMNHLLQLCPGGHNCTESSALTLLLAAGAADSGQNPADSPGLAAEMAGFGLRDGQNPAESSRLDAVLSGARGP